MEADQEQPLRRISVSPESSEFQSASHLVNTVLQRGSNVGLTIMAIEHSRSFSTNPLRTHVFPDGVVTNNEVFEGYKDFHKGTRQTYVAVLHAYIAGIHLSVSYECDEKRDPPQRT